MTFLAAYVIIGAVLLAALLGFGVIRFKSETTIGKRDIPELWTEIPLAIVYVALWPLVIVAFIVAGKKPAPVQETVAAEQRSVGP